MTDKLIIENKNLIYETYLKENQVFNFLKTKEQAAEVIVNEYILEENVKNELDVNFLKQNKKLKVFLEQNNYRITDFDQQLPTHFLIQINSNLVDKTNERYNNIVNYFYKYQLYNECYKDPTKIYKTEAFKHYFTGVLMKDSSLNLDYTELKKIHNNNIRLYLYVYKEIFLILLYKIIIDVYISFYNYLDEDSGKNIKDNDKYKEIILERLNDIESVINNKILKNSEINSLNIEVQKEDNKLKLKTGANNQESKNLYNTINPKYHVIESESEIDGSYHYYEIPYTTTLHSDEYYVFNNPINNLDFLFTEKNYRIITKTSLYYEYKYNSNIATVKKNTKNINHNKYIYSNEQNYLKLIKNNNIDTLYYLTFLMIFIILIGIASTKSEKSRKIRVFILLIITVISYSIILGVLSTPQHIEYFSEEEAETTTTKLRTKYNELLLQLLIQINTTAPKIGMNNLYDKFGKIIHKDIKDTNLYNKYLENNIDNLSSNKNNSWHEIFKKTLFIHTTFIIIIVILIYLWLYSIIPDSNIYLLTITIIFCMILLFNYFRNLHRVLRTKYTKYYWPKINIK